MKRILIALALATCGGAAAHAQTGYHVTLETANAPTSLTTQAGLSGRIYLFSEDTGVAIDSADYSGKTIQLEGQARLPQIASLATDNRGRNKLALFILDETPLTASLQADGLHLSGSAVNEKWSAVMAGLDKGEEEVGLIWQELNRQAQSYGSPQDMPQSLKTQGQERLYDAVSRQQKLLAKALEENRDNLLPAMLIATRHKQMESGYVERYMETYAFRDNGILEEVRQNTAAGKRRQAGALFADFTMEDINGTPRRLSDYVGRGQYVLLDFWASWCGPCRAEIPNVREAYSRFHPKGFEIVGVSLDTQKGAWRQATEQLGITWPQLSDLKGWKNEAGQLYGIRSIPFTILFDPDGKVVGTNLRGEALWQALEKAYP